jgi:aspartyl-tRNA(Asn)/glutamyl-tRNA(Gln) amidotransferase subunit A
MTIADVAPRLASGDVSAAALVRACLDRIDAREELHAFITVLADQALADADAADREIAAGRYLGPLHGIPISLKDLIAVGGVPTTSGSAVPPLHPAADAPVVRRLRQAGAIIIGKTNLHEFAYGTTSDETAFGAVHHPLDYSRSPGGSSGGAAVALVEGMCLASIGTDTGGSIRIPAAACGIVGLKPAFGELSCDGIVPLSTSCDHVGPMTSSVEDARVIFRILKGLPPAAALIETRRLTFGVPTGYLVEKLDPEVRGALERVRTRLSRAGHQVIDVTIENSDRTPDIYLHIVVPEASWYHAPTLDSDPSGYSPGVRLRLEMGRYLLAEDYVRALNLRARLTARVDDALGMCDALLLPTLPVVAPVIGSPTVDIDGRPEPVRAATLRLTQLFNLTGHPAIALPAGVNGAGLPVSMQLVGGETERLLAIAAVVESQIADGFGSVGGGAG